ncbi:uncharacterized protein STEHIDRAFT_50846 [Stereum hirsutum FP-91666 SS1]|uniref:uncharacterized protein n=1 Tax=Stereum hirsutum (strain FP-91666) TaxID=721885 RepID=UPI000440CAD5|nr:uncharacterized protein STEHIDRAFT_50846 [Stereum hirsutum FP-91666 SS1]EIM90489.1 hypothetical protein STEHIDRAFT_50846 [Stereum hirsutum FP-91666 SS1]
MYTTVPVLCDDRASFNSAVAALSSSRTLYFDCEGVKLGTAGGTLSLITIRSAPSPSNSRQSDGDRNGQTFIFDITSLTLARQPVSLKPLFALLTSPKVLKVVWDGRMDSSALHHYFRVNLRNVLDLQLVDIHSRELRGETIQEHVKRFIGGVDPRTLSNENRAIQTYALVHRLSGLSQAVTEHQPSVGKQFKKIPGT